MSTLRKSWRRWRPPRFVCTVGVATVAVLITATANAGALIIHLNGTTIGFEPLPRHASALAKGPSGKRPLEYHGGPVMPSNSNYALFWDPSGTSGYPAGYIAGIDRYFEDLAHDSGGEQNTDSVLVQYHDSAGQAASYSSSFAGALIDTDPYPANGCSAAPKCLTDEQIRTEIKKYVEAEKLPTDLEHEYFLLTPEGVESCIEAAGHACSAGSKHPEYCSYHSYIPVGTSVIVYANIPYLEGTNCDTGEEHPNDNPSDATLGGGLVHEHSESVTDPELNAWYDSKGEEVADKCRTFKVSTEFGPPLGKAPDGANYNQVINKDLYWYQQMWSNAAEACEQRTAQASQAPTVTNVSPKSGPDSGGTTVTLTGSGYEGTVEVFFGGVAATDVSVQSSSTLSALSPADSAGTVDVTVKTAGGTSPISKKDHFKYKR